MLLHWTNLRNCFVMSRTMLVSVRINAQRRKNLSAIEALKWTDFVRSRTFLCDYFSIRNNTTTRTWKFWFTEFFWPFFQMYGRSHCFSPLVKIICYVCAMTCCAVYHGPRIPCSAAEFYFFWRNSFRFRNGLVWTLCPNSIWKIWRNTQAMQWTLMSHWSIQRMFKWKSTTICTASFGRCKIFSEIRINATTPFSGKRLHW